MVLPEKSGLQMSEVAVVCVHLVASQKFSIIPIDSLYDPV